MKYNALPDPGFGMKYSSLPDPGFAKQYNSLPDSGSMTSGSIPGSAMYRKPGSMGITSPSMTTTPTTKKKVPTVQELEAMAKNAGMTPDMADTPGGNIAFSKVLYDSGKSSGNTGLMDTAHQNALPSYGKIDPGMRDTVSNASSSEMINYLKSYTPTPTGTATQGQQGQGQGQAAGDAHSPYNHYYGDAEKLMQDYLKAVNTPFQFDAESDPSYKAAKEINNRNAASSSQAAMEALNSRGILDSTITSENVADVYKQAGDATTALIPQLQANAWNQRESNLSNLSGLINTNMNMGYQTANLQNNDRQFNWETKNADRQFNLQEGAMLGSYMPSEAKGLFDTVMEAKRVYDNPNATTADKKQASDSATIARQKLAELGYDPNIVGSDLSTEQAAGNIGKVGRTPTFQATQAGIQNNQGLMNTILSLAGNYTSIPGGTGSAIGQIPGMGQIGSYVGGLEGINTSQGLQVLSGLASSQQSAGYQNFLKSQKIDEASAAKATNKTLSDLFGFNNRDEAIKYVLNNQGALMSNGVDMKTVADFLSGNGLGALKPVEQKPDFTAKDTATIKTNVLKALANDLTYIGLPQDAKPKYVQDMVRYVMENGELPTGVGE